MARPRAKSAKAAKGRVGAGYGVPLLAGVVIVMLALGVVWLGQMLSSGSSAVAGPVPATILDAAKTKGNDSAPVLVEEWGDFQ